MGNTTADAHKLPRAQTTMTIGHWRKEWRNNATIMMDVGNHNGAKTVPISDNSKE